MPGLRDRLKAGTDSIAGFEGAAQERYREAVLLRRLGRNYAAIYICGYAIEMWLKAAFFWNENVCHHTAPITVSDRDRAWRMRASARVTFGQNHHDLSVWARLLTYVRAATGILSPFPPQLKLEIERVADAARKHWDPELRYRHIEIMPGETRTVFKAASWLRRHYNAL